MRELRGIIGPTGVGKTSLALKLAKDNIIISCDSVQAYKHCDVISGKDISPSTKFIKLKEQPLEKFNLGYYLEKKVPIYLLDVATPDYNFNVSDYSMLVKHVLTHTNKPPIIVGGTTLYFNALLDGIGTANISPDPLLREKLNAYSTEDLQNKLQKINSEKLSSMNNSDKNNPRRLIRAIEVALSKNEKPLEPLKAKWNIIGLTADIKILKKRIEKRVEERLKNGALEEIDFLADNFSTLSPSLVSSSGYKQLIEYKKGKITLKEAIEKWKNSDLNVAKKQLKYFKKLPNITWIDTTNKSDIQVQNEAKKALNLT